MISIPRAFIAATAAGAAALAAASATFQAVRERQDRRRFPPPGRLVEVDGRRLHLLCEGQGSPTVVVIPALGSSSIEWIAIQRRLVPGVRVCLYDRGGLGWSDYVPGSRDLGVLADELYALLQAADVPPPYVLVGHSIGGLIARLVATRHPADIAGLVLVDSSHEEQFERFAAVFGWRDQRAIEWSAVRNRVKWLGLSRALIDLGLKRSRRAKMAYQCPPDLVDCGLALALTSSDHKASIREMLGWRRGSSQVRLERAPFGDLPISVITRSADLAVAPHGHFPGPDAERREALWQELQASMLGLSDETHQVLSKKAGHNIHLDDPDLVVDEIRRMCERVAD